MKQAWWKVAASTLVLVATASTGCLSSSDDGEGADSGTEGGVVLEAGQDSTVAPGLDATAGDVATIDAPLLDGATGDGSTALDGSDDAAADAPGTDGTAAIEAGIDATIPDATTNDGPVSEAGLDSTVSEGGKEGGALVTYTHDAQPIFLAHCGDCHGGNDDGETNFASVYADTQVAPYETACADVSTVGACALILIQDGDMPQDKGCTGNPTTDVGNSACLTQAEQSTIFAWIADGEAQ